MLVAVYWKARPATLDAADLPLLARGINRRDFDQTAIPELGFSFSLWSGSLAGGAYEFSGQIGNVTDISNNRLLLRLPDAGPLTYDGNASRLRALFNTWVALTGADQGVIGALQAIAWDGSRLSPDIPCLACWRHCSSPSPT